MSFALEYAFVIITLFSLIWASYQDLRDRMVSDLIWIVQIVASLPFLIIWFIDYADYFMVIIGIFNLILAFIVAIFIHLLGGIGAGDRNAIIALGFSTPFYAKDISLINVPGVLFPAIPVILTNIMLFMVLFIIVRLIWNLKSRSKFGGLFSETSGSILGKLSVLISGRRVPVDAINTLRFDDPAEEYEDGKWKLYKTLFSEMLEDEGFEKIEQENRDIAHQKAIETSRSYLWMRPQPPGIVYFLLGYIYWILLGSPYYYIFN